jgi:hypothetical protein
MSEGNERDNKLAIFKMSIIIFLSISSFGKIFARSSKIEESI